MLRIGKTAENWTGQHNSWKKQILMFRQNWNSWVAEHHVARYLSLLSDGSIHNSKWPVDYELRLSENGRAAELTFCHKSGFCQNFTMTSPETMYTKVAINELSFLLVTHTTYSDERFDSYGIFWSQVTVLNCFGQIGHWNKTPALGAKNEWILMRLDYRFHSLLAQVFNAYSNTWFR
jgi:hypothetical protein